MSVEAAHQLGYVINIAEGLILGAVCGILPLVIGVKEKKSGLGVAGIACCIAAGLMYGVYLALPVSAVWAAGLLLSLKGSESKSDSRPQTQQVSEETPIYEQQQVEETPAPEEPQVSEAPAEEELQTTEVSG